MGFKIRENGRCLVFLTDNELTAEAPLGRQPADFAHFAQGCDLLIHDTQYLPEELRPTGVGAIPALPTSSNWLSWHIFPRLSSSIMIPAGLTRKSRRLKPGPGNWPRPKRAPSKFQPPERATILL